jgi:hypothetical protein
MSAAARLMNFAILEAKACLRGRPHQREASL